MITPGAIPQVTGDLDACYSHGFMVSVLGSRFADTGSAVMRSWSGLSGVYVAPESGVLLQAMVPVAFTAGGVGADLNTTGSAIMVYATAVRPIKARFQGWDVMGQSWKGLGALAIVAASPQVMFSNQGFPGYQPGEIQATVTGMGKGLIAYDRWSSDPAQAAGESVFNIATFFIPVGGAAAGTAKAASLVGKTAQVVGVAGTAAKVADVLKASRVADVVAGVRTTLDLRLNNAANALHTAMGGPDRALAGPGRRHLPEAPVPHTPDLHATTVHPDAPAAPHPDGPTGSHGEGAPPHGPGREAVVRDERGHVKGVPGDPAQTLQRRVELGFPNTLSDPRASPLFPPGYDPLHGHSVDQAIHDLSNGSYPDGSPVWDYANQAPDGGKIVGDARYPVSHEPVADWPRHRPIRGSSRKLRLARRSAISEPRTTTRGGWICLSPVSGCSGDSG